MSKRKLDIGKRWFSVPEHVRIHSVLSDFKSTMELEIIRFIIVAATRRGFKSEYVKRYIARWAIRNANKEILIGAPTFAQVKRNFWNDMQKLIPTELIVRVSVIELSLLLYNGTRITLASMQEAKRIEGGFLHLAYLDEIQDVPPTAFYETISPMLNDVGGRLIATGRPHSKGFFYDLYNMEKESNNWKSFTWTGETVLSQEQITEAKATLDEATYEREYMANFEVTTSNPYYSYSSENWRECEFDRSLGNLMVCCDFNATSKRMSWVIGQKRPKMVTVKGGSGKIQDGFEIELFDVIYKSYTNTETTCGVMIDKLGKLKVDRRTPIIFYGDYAGNSRTSNSNRTDWQIIQEQFRNYNISINVKPTKSIPDSIASTNSLLKSVDGNRRLFVNKRTCAPLIKDWVLCEWMDDQKKITETDDRGHLCRAVDYFSNYDYPIKKGNSLSIS